MPFGTFLHGAPHAPQLAMSEERSTQTLPQQLRPGGHIPQPLGAHTPAWHDPLWQSPPKRHTFPSAHRGQIMPPQSMSLSSPFLSPSLHNGGGGGATQVA